MGCNGINRVLLLLQYFLKKKSPCTIHIQRERRETERPVFCFIISFISVESRKIVSVFKTVFK